MLVYQSVPFFHKTSLEKRRKLQASRSFDSSGAKHRNSPYGYARLWKNVAGEGMNYDNMIGNICNRYYLVGGYTYPKNMKVSWDDYSEYMET